MQARSPLRIHTKARESWRATSRPRILRTAEIDLDLGCHGKTFMSSTSTARSPALLVLTRDQGQNMTRRFSPGDGYAPRDPSTPCTARSAGVDAGGTHFAVMGERRGCFGCTACSLIEEILRVARRAARARQKEQRGFLTQSDRGTRVRPIRAMRCQFPCSRPHPPASLFRSI